MDKQIVLGDKNIANCNEKMAENDKEEEESPTFPRAITHSRSSTSSSLSTFKLASRLGSIRPVDSYKVDVLWSQLAIPRGIEITNITAYLPTIPGHSAF